MSIEHHVQHPVDPSSHPAADRTVVVIGGGPAGLQAALTLGRVHRDVLLLDAGEGRNAPATHMHNLVTRDGTPPAEFRRIAQAELAAYPTVEVRRGRVDVVRDLSAKAGGATLYAVDLADGSSLTVRRVVLATGVRDELPDVPGLDALWGDLVAHCPFCHGHEFSGRRVAVLGAVPAAHLPALLRPVAAEVVVLTDGEELSAPVDAEVVGDRVLGVERHDGGVRVSLEQGRALDVAGLFVGTTLRQTAPFAEQLGLALNPSGGVRVDERGRTSLRGVYAAGDMAHVPALPMPMASVAQAVAAGMMAGATVVADLLADA